MDEECEGLFTKKAVMDMSYIVLNARKRSTLNIMSDLIYVQESEFKFRRCNVCDSDKNVKEIIFRYFGTNSGNRIVLCEDCRDRLISILLEVGNGSDK